MDGLRPSQPNLIFRKIVTLKYCISCSPGSLYVSGAPGTGKTASLNHLLTSRLTNQKTVFINCMILKSAVSIYKVRGGRNWAYNMEESLYLFTVIFVVILYNIFYPFASS